MPSKNTDAQQAEWQDNYDRIMAEYNAAHDEERGKIPQYAEESQAYFLSKNVGDKVKAECDLFKFKMAEQYDPLGEGTRRHLNCVRIDD